MNRIVVGDNLSVMRGMEDRSIDLVYMDPPFNTGRDFGAFDDRWKSADDSQAAELDSLPRVSDAVSAALEIHGYAMHAHVVFMAVRLLEMQRLLKPEGSIYLHCDPRASHYMKLLMDAMFGSGNFRNEIVWCYTGPGRNTRQFKRKHDIIFWYSAGREWKFEPVRVPYKRTPSVKYTLGKRTHGDTHWREAAKGYEARGKMLEDWWTDPRPLAHHGERTGYPTQKPLALMERIIKASSDKGDVVLDPFCGSGTTLVAAELAGRKWIGIDASETAIETTEKRLRGMVGADWSRETILSK